MLYYKNGKPLTAWLKGKQGEKMEEQNTNELVENSTAKKTDDEPPRKTNKLKNWLDNYFKVTKSGSTFRIEIIAGLTTFMTMVYALLVVPGMYNSSVSFNAVYIATALGAITGTMLMAFMAKMPLAQASGLGATALTYREHF